MTVVVLPGVKLLDPKLTVVPNGLPFAVKFIGVENPPMAVLVRLAVILLFAPHKLFAPVELEKLKVILLEGTMLKLALEISK